MATKDYSFSTNKKKNDSYFNDSSNGKYSNFKLNRGHKYSENCFGETETSKFDLKNDRYKFSGAFNSFKEEKNKPLFDSDKSWKIPFQLKQEPFGSRYSNISKIKDNKKSKNAFDSRDRGFSLSDYIQKKMHLYESPVEEDEISTLKKDKKKFKSAIEQLLYPPANLQDSWEFPRQQKEDAAQEPEVMHFAASQKLFHPSQNDEINQLPDNYGDTNDKNGFAGIPYRGVLDMLVTIKSFLGHGGFGAVYCCEDKNGKEYAIKCAVDAEEMEIEIEILKKANEANTKHLCRLHDYGEDNTYFFMVIDLLGPTLETVVNDKKFDHWSAEMRWKIAEQCLIGIQNLHELGYLHLDLKPANIAMGRGENQYMVYLFDFGVSLKNGSSRKKSIGGDIHASIAAMELKNLGPKDDLESWLYMVKELRGEQLPWDVKVEGDDEEQKKKNIIGMKKDLRNDQSNIFKQFFGKADSLFKKAETVDLTPYKKTRILKEDKRFPELLLIMRYLDTLKAEASPDYGRILFYLQSGYERERQKVKTEFEAEMEKIKNDAVKSILGHSMANDSNKEKELLKKFKANKKELEELSKHCRSNVPRPQYIAFFVGYECRDDCITETNPDGKLFTAIEFNGKRMTLNHQTTEGNWYHHKLENIRVKVDYDGNHKLGEEAKIKIIKNKNGNSIYL